MGTKLNYNYKLLHGISNNFDTGLCTTGIAGYRDGEVRLYEKSLFFISINLLTGHTPKLVSRLCTTSLSVSYIKNRKLGRFFMKFKCKTGTRIPRLGY